MPTTGITKTKTKIWLIKRDKNKQTRSRSSLRFFCLFCTLVSPNWRGRERFSVFLIFFSPASLVSFFPSISPLPLREGGGELMVDG